VDPPVIVWATYSPTLRPTLEHFQEAQFNRVAHLSESDGLCRLHCGGSTVKLGTIF
jgi:hypothetical protein